MSNRLPPARFPAPLASEEVSKRGLTNSLGMKFVPVPGTAILFCIHETRRQDYEAFASEVPGPGPGTAWRTAIFLGVPTGAGADHPVSAVSWDQAGRFCEWLSRKEGRKYRLPTDHEWSIAVGLGEVERDDPKVTPQMESNAGRVELPYGGQWPPQSPAHVGNYGDLTVHRQWPDRIYIPGYEDGYATSAPVMSYPPNPFGLYDMGGNVWEWVADWLNENHDRRIIRGGSWADVHEATFLSARRFPAPSNVEQNNLGFHVVLAPDL